MWWIDCKNGFKFSFFFNLSLAMNLGSNSHQEAEFISLLLVLTGFGQSNTAKVKPGPQEDLHASAHSFGTLLVHET